MDIQSQLRQFKDFLQLYNLITEHCFKHCISNNLTRSVEEDENSCLGYCVDKYANTNQVIMKTYVEVQSVINEKRMAEFTAQQQQLELQQQQQQEVTTESS